MDGWRFLRESKTHIHLQYSEEIRESTRDSSRHIVIRQHPSMVNIAGCGGEKSMAEAGQRRQWWRQWKRGFEKRFPIVQSNSADPFS